MTDAYSIEYSAPISGVTGGSLGAVIGVLNGANVVASTANIALGCIPGKIIRSTPGPADANGTATCDLQNAGTVPAGITGLGSGTVSPVIVSNGALARKASPIYGTDWIVGDCDALGTLVLSWGISHVSPPRAVQFAGTCTPEMFNAVGDGVTDDTTAFTSAFSALSSGTYKALVLGAKTYLVQGNFTVPAGCAVIGQGHSSILKTVTNQVMLIVGGENVVLARFKILGDRTWPGDGTHLAQDGISVGVPAGSGWQRVHVTDVQVASVGGSGFIVRRPQVDARFGPILTACRADECVGKGFAIQEQCENVILNACSAWSCSYCFYIAAGNTVLNGCVGNSGYYGLYIATATNDSHGQANGCSFDHDTLASIYSENTSNGFIVQGCHIYQGQIQLVGTAGVAKSASVDFVGCTIDVNAYVFDGCSGVRFIACRFPAGGLYPNTVTDNANGHTSQVYWSEDNNLLGTNELPTFVAARIQLQYTFPSDANQNLTAQQSMAAYIVVLDGVTTATRKITSTQSPFTGISPTLVINQNAQSVQFAYASGTAVTIVSGATALIGCTDGTNAVKLQ
jgi:hypothetical protein